MGKNSRFMGDWGSVNCNCDILDKKESIFNYMMLMFNRTNQMFEYTGLPDTIPDYMLETFVQINGHIGFVKWNDELYALPGGLGGAPDPYYRPTIYTIANPALGGSKMCKILNHLPPYDRQMWDEKDDCVIMKNDTHYTGLFYLCSRYATQLAENDVSIRSAQINSRFQAFIAAPSDRELASANKYLQDLVDGKLAAVGDLPFLDGIKAANLSVQGANTILQLIELQQYLKASWYNEIGLNANFNMKREYLSEEEIRSSTDVLLPLIDNMLRCREEAVNLVNSTFGTSITVKKNSAWENKQDEVDTEQEQAEADVDATKAKTEEASDA